MPAFKSQLQQPKRRGNHVLQMLLLLLLVVALFLCNSNDTCDAAPTAGGKRRSGGGRGWKHRGLPSTASVHVVPCPAQSCRCRLTKSGDAVARCSTLPLFRHEPPSPLDSTVTASNSSGMAVGGGVVYAELVVRRANVTQLPSVAFRGVRTKSLDLAGTRLRSIADDAFDGLSTTVEVLTLSDCGLVEVPTASLLSLKSMRVLRLDQNNIVDIAGGLLSTCCSSLRELNLYRNQLTQVHNETFAGLDRLEKLSLAENRLESLQADVFSGLTSLVHLDLGRNRLHRVADGWLNGLVNLRWIELTSNRLRSIGRSTFRGAPKLRYMMADNNQLDVIADGSFRVIRRLSYLSIDVANSSTLTASTLAGTGRLKTLIFGELRATSLPAGFFGAARRLKYLSLSNSDGSLQTEAPGGLRPELFHTDFRFRQLNVWLTPIHGCRCSEPWIRALGARGVYVHGYCDDERPLSCTAGSKSTSAGGASKDDGARGKLANGRFKSAHTSHR